jgi:hypothetical protein
MAQHWTPLSMVSRSVVPCEWRMADRREDLGWIRRVDYQGRKAFVCVTRDGWVVGGGDTLRDAAEAFLSWKRSRVATP